MPFTDLSSDRKENQNISAHPFFPSVNTAAFYLDYRIPQELPFSLVVEMLKNAIVSVQASLMVWAKCHMDKGLSSLSVVPDKVLGEVLAVDGVAQKEVLYIRAVFCLAKSEILKETQTVDRTEDAENAAKTADDIQRDYEYDAMIALAKIQGKNQVRVSLL